jgi:hypothetical protein
MDPIIFSALGGLLVNALSGIVGNRADAAGGHDLSRELYISDEGIVVRALKWQ